jgi:2-keto-3-deoxy-6-phosphogluconate aldolase
MSNPKTRIARVDQIVRGGGVVVVMNRKHVKTAEHLITTMWEVYQAGYVAECTFRIDVALLREAMQELTRRRAQCPANKPFVLAVGSIINPDELNQAIEMGFDVVVAPANVMGGYGEGKELVRLCHEAGVFCAPAVFTPTELQYFIERPDGLEPDAIKVFPADSHGPSGLKSLLAPFVRPRHYQRIIMPTGGVNEETGPAYQEAILAHGFFPVLGMSAPLSIVEQKVRPGDVETIRESLTHFKKAFRPYPIQNNHKNT